MDTDRFAKGTERLVDPVTVGSIHFLQQFVGLVPRGVQRSLLTRSSEASPYMGFVVEPYAFFLFYEVADQQRAAALLPEGFRGINMVLDAGGALDRNFAVLGNECGAVSAATTGSPFTEDWHNVNEHYGYWLFGGLYTDTAAGKRLVRLARLVAKNPQLELVCLQSFGCGFDAISLAHARALLNETAGAAQPRLPSRQTLGATAHRLPARA